MKDQTWKQSSVYQQEYGENSCGLSTQWNIAQARKRTIHVYHKQDRSQKHYKDLCEILKLMKF